MNQNNWNLYVFFYVKVNFSFFFWEMNDQIKVTDGNHGVSLKK